MKTISKLSALILSIMAISTTPLIANSNIAKEKQVITVALETKKETKLTADEMLKKASTMLFPEKFTAEIEMTQVKPNTANTVSKMKLYKLGDDLVRSDYTEPAAQNGQKMLRKEGQIWMYLPDTKRAIKLSSKNSLNGGDFSNGDIMRLDLVKDYTPTITKEDASTYLLELKAKDRAVSYDLIKYTISKKDFSSIRMEYYTLSGKLMKTLDFKEFKDYAGFKRPSLFVMTNMLAEGVYTNMKYLQFQPNTTLPESQFRADALSNK